MLALSKRRRGHPFRDSSRQFVVGGVALAVAMSLLGCAGMPLPPGGGSLPPLPAAAAVTFCDKPAPACASATSFSLSSLRDLNIVVNWQNVPEGTHVQTLSIFLPDGNLYQALESTFEIPEGAPGSATTELSLPVAGTWITQRSLTGAWRFTLSLDEQDRASSSLQLTP
jgi:hypothetical protein